MHPSASRLPSAAAKTCWEIGGSPNSSAAAPRHLDTARHTPDDRWKLGLSLASDALPEDATWGATTGRASGLQQAGVCADGLRRRPSAAQGDVGTPEVYVGDDSAASPRISEETFPVAGTARSSRRWSGRGDDSDDIGPQDATDAAHKTQRAAAIAETLRGLEAASAADVCDYSALSDRGDGEASMTITLKAPRKAGGSDADDEADGDAPIPAVYLDGAASLWDHYVAELETSEFDPGVHLKRKRVSQFLRVPWNVEKLLWFGVAICFDALLHVFAILPARFVRALLGLVAGAARSAPALLVRACALACARVAASVLPGAWHRRLATLWRRAATRVRGTGSAQAADGAARWVPAAQLFDFYRGLLLIATCVVLSRIDAAQMYHTIRAQSSLKLYFIYSALDICDRLLSTFGHDALDALQSTTLDPWSRRWRSGIRYYAIAQVSMLVHTVILFYQVITLNVAVNAYGDQLLSLLISNQFVEIKSNVFKKWEKEMLFQIGCADIVERFQEIAFLFIIIVRNLAELSGTGLSPLLNMSPPSPSSATGATAPVVQTPVSFAGATPSAFGPLIPAWVSMPMVHRIVTPVLMVLGTELLIDWTKHAFVTKLNWIRPEIYSHYIDILARDLSCARSGSGVRAAASVAPPGSGGDAGMPDDEQAHADSALDSEVEEPLAAGCPRTHSSSVLGHAVLKALAWARSSVGTEPADRAADGAAGGGGSSRSSVETVRVSESRRRRRGHRRVGSTTRPQLFVDQSSRVARRLGLAPLPLACLVILMVAQVSHILLSPPQQHHAGAPTAWPTPAGGHWLASVPLLGGLLQIALRAPTEAGWTALDVVGWAAVALIAYALVVWAKLAFSARLMHFAWVRYRAFERRTAAGGAGGAGPDGLKQFDDATRKQDRDDFAEVGRLVAREPAEAEWEQQRPKWTLDNIERYSLFKSRIT
ncbi:hypothetical protein IWQ56_002275 [Coemansia nantahalensis]|nr:hypothetical protein IWQ56_002275 [Coemansia nantahalensis]